MRKILLHLALAVGLAATLALAAAHPTVAATVAWQRVYDGPLHGSDGFTAVVPGTGDSVYAAGYSAVSGLRRSDMLLVRYAPDGTRKWVRFWNGPACGSDRCWGLARDAAGALYLIGSTAGRGGDAAIVKYSAGGKLLWSRRYDSGGGRQDDARLVRAIPGRDGIYVVVETRTAGGWRWRVMRYTSDGSRKWVSASLGSHASDAVTDGAGNLYVSGWVESASKWETQVDSYSPSGVHRWTGQPQGSRDFNRATAVTDRRDGIAWVMNSTDVTTQPDHGWITGCSYSAFDWGSWSSVDFNPLAGYEFFDLAGTAAKGVIAVGRIARVTGGEGLVIEVDGAGNIASDGIKTWSSSVDCSGDLVVVGAGDTAWIAGKHGSQLSVLHYEPGSGLTWRYDYGGHDASRALALAAASGPGAYVTGWGRDAGKGANALIMRVAP